MRVAFHSIILRNILDPFPLRMIFCLIIKNLLGTYLVEGHLVRPTECIELS